MSAVLEKLNGPQIPEALPTTELPDASVLEDRTPEWIRTTPTSALFMLLIGVVFALMANRPLWHTDLWDHLNYGQKIIETRTVSVTEPLMLNGRDILEVVLARVVWLTRHRRWEDIDHLRSDAASS